MFLTKELLEKYDACKPGQKWFSRYFPEGGELMDVIQHKYVSPEILHWGFTHLTTTAEEQKTYREKLNINCENYQSIYESDNVSDSEYVSRSSRITKSNYIFSSKDVEESEDISLSENVQDSTQIFGSEFVYSSNRILHSKNITDSHNIVNSDYVVNSHSIVNSATVTNSMFVGGLALGNTKQIKDSRFIADCSNLKHCLFCHGINDAEYMIFNKQVDAADYEIIVRQLDKLLCNYEAMLIKGEWSSHTIPLDAPTIQRNIAKQYENLPESFWRWIKTVPGFDSTIMYSLTYNKKIL